MRGHLSIDEQHPANSWVEAEVAAFGAKLDGKLAGITRFFIHPSTSGPDVCYLQDLFTAPDERADEVFMTNIGLLVSSISSIEPLGFQAKSVEYTRKFTATLEEDIHIQR